MKKVFLLASIAGLISFTSCKKETQDKVDNAIEQTGEAAEATANDVADKANEAFETTKAAVTDAPQIEDTELQEWVNKLHDEAVKAKVASKAGNQADLNAATAQITSLVQTLSTHKDKADYAKAEAYYKQIQEELQQQ